MRWERFFDDLEVQLASEWEAERAALDSEAERLRLASVTMRERLRALCDREECAITVEFSDGATVVASVDGVGADWVSLGPRGVSGRAILAPLTGIRGLRLTQTDLIASARPLSAPHPVAERITFGYALRDLARRRVAVDVYIVGGGSFHGTVDRAGADHLDLAVHERGSFRRADAVTGFRIVPFAAVVRLVVDAPISPV